MSVRVISFVVLSLLLHAAVLIGSLMHVTLPHANVSSGPMSVEFVVAQAPKEKPTQPTFSSTAIPPAPRVHLVRQVRKSQPTPVAPTPLSPEAVTHLARQTRALLDTTLHQAHAAFDALSSQVHAQHEPAILPRDAVKPTPRKPVTQAKPTPAHPPVPTTQPAPPTVPPTTPAVQPTTQPTPNPPHPAPKQIALVHSSKHPSPTPAANVQAGLPDPLPPQAAPTNPPPLYPAKAREKGQQGTVTLKLHVDAEGEVTSVDIAQSSGFPLLDQAARNALAQWHFTPATRGGEPEASRLIYPIHFVLKG